MPLCLAGQRHPDRPAPSWPASAILTGQRHPDRPALARCRARGPWHCGLRPGQPTSHVFAPAGWTAGHNPHL